MSSFRPESDEEGAVDPAVARAERRLAVLQRLTEIGMELVEALRDRVIEGQADEAEGKAEGRAGDAADAFAKLSRAVRLTLALEARTDQALRDHSNAGEARSREEAVADPLPPRRAFLDRTDEDSKADAFDLIVAVAETEGERLQDFEAFLDALVETPEDMEAAAAGRYQPLGPTIERLCRELGLSADLSRQLGEGWEVGYLACRPRWNPFSRERREPISTSPPNPTGAPGPSPIARASGP